MRTRTELVLQVVKWVVTETRNAIPYSSNRTEYEHIFDEYTPSTYLSLLQDLLRADIKKSGSADKAIVNEIRRKLGIEFLSDDALAKGIDVLFPLTIYSWGRKFASIQELYSAVKKRFTKKMWNKPNRSDLEYVEAQAIRGSTNRIGNCGETSAYAFLLLTEYPSSVADGRPPLPDVPIKVERLQYKKPGDHAFTVLNRTDGELSNIATWNDDAVICDPWVSMSYTVADWKRWQAFPDERPGYIIDKQYALELHDPLITAKKPYAFLGEHYNKVNGISVHSEKWERKHKITDKSFRPLYLVSSAIQRDMKNIRAFYQAAKKGDVDYIKQHLASSSLRINHRALIELAIENGHVDMVNLLVGTPGFQLKNYLPELINLSIANNQLKIFELLCRQDPATSKMDSRRMAVLLLIAISNGHLEMIRHFEQQYGALVNKHLQQHGLVLMQRAAKSGQVEALKYLMQRRPDLDSLSNKEQLLLLAAKSNHLNVVEFLISSGVNPSMTDQNKHTVPYIAAQAGCLNIVLYYVALHYTDDYPFNFNEKDKYGNTLLHAIAKNTDLKFEQVKKIFNAAGKHIDEKNNVGETPFMLAVRCENYSLISLLLTRPIALACVKNMSPLEMHHLFFAALHMEDEDKKITILDGLRKNGLDFEAKDEEGNTLLHVAVQEHDVAVVEFLIQYRANVQATNSDGDTPLHLAVRDGKRKIVKELLLEDANFSVANKKNETPFSLAVQDKDVKILAEFLEEEDQLKAVVCPLLSDAERKDLIQSAILFNTFNVVDYMLDSAPDAVAKKHLVEYVFMLAVEKRENKLVKRLLRRGVDVNSKDAVGNTALHIAALNNDENMLKLLRRVDQINLSDKNNNGETALMLAVRNNNFLASSYLFKYSTDLNDLKQMTANEVWFLLHSAGLELLKEKKLNLFFDACKDIGTIRNPDENNETVLHRAARKKEFHMIEPLLAKGADINARDSESKTPLFRAVECGAKNNYAIIKLIDNGALIQEDEAYSQEGLLVLLQVLSNRVTQYNELVIAILKQAVKMGYLAIVSEMLESRLPSSEHKAQTSGLIQHSLLAQSSQATVSLQQELPRLLPLLLKMAEDNHQPDIATYLRSKEKAAAMQFKST